jgi:hypothetical protein
MPIHFGYAITGNARPSTALRSRGLNLARAAPSEVKITFVPDAILLAYYLVASILSRFLISLAKQTVVPPGTCSRIPPLPRLVPFRLPPLVIQLTDNNPAMMNSFLASGFESQVVRNKTLLLKDRPTIQDFQLVMTNPSINRKCYVPFKYVNTEGMMTFLTMRKIATLFLDLAIFPAFDATSRTVDTFLGKTSTPRTPAVPTAEASTSKSTSLTTSYRWNWNRVTGSGLLVSDPNAFGPNEAHITFHSEANWGSSSTVIGNFPAGQNGVFIPYVSDLAKADDSGPIDFIQRYAFQCLGNTQQQCFEEMKQLRGGWGHVKNTTTGHQLAHLFRCIGLSLEGQCAMTCIITERGRYDGCVLAGSGFTILTDGIQSRPVEGSALKSEITGYGSHENAVQQICAIIGDELEPQTFPETMASLRTILLASTLSEAERSEIQLHTPHLDFEEDHWGVNPNNLESFLEICATGVMPDTTPITHSALFEPNTSLAALSAFGYQSCPSFRIPSGRSLDLRKPMPAPKTSMIQKGKKRTAEVAIDDFEQTIQVQLINYRQARSDFTEMTVDGLIRVVPVGNTSDNVRVYRGAIRGTLWNALTKVVHTAPGGGAQDEVVAAVGNTGLSGHGTVRVEDVSREIDAYL